MTILDDLKAQLKSFREDEESVAKTHARLRKLTQQFDVAGPEMRSVENFKIGHGEIDIPVRLYVPHGAQDLGATHVYLHGGGFVTCDLDSHDGLCRRLALSSGHRVLSVDYRLAPRFPYPAGPDDCERALVWALNQGDERGIDGERVSIGGDSAGGNMAAYLAQKYRRDLTAQLLFYPLMQLAEKRPQKLGWQDRLELGKVALDYIEKAYVGKANVQDPRLSPLFETHLAGLPPAYILTCELDPLREEGRAYADMLRAAGNRVEQAHEKIMPHGFLNFAKAFPPGRKVPVLAGEFLRSADQQRRDKASWA